MRCRFQPIPHLTPFNPHFVSSFALSPSAIHQAMALFCWFSMTLSNPISIRLVLLGLVVMPVAVLVLPFNVDAHLGLMVALLWNHLGVNLACFFIVRKSYSHTEETNKTSAPHLVVNWGSQVWPSFMTLPDLERKTKSLGSRVLSYSRFVTFFSFDSVRCWATR